MAQETRRRRVGAELQRLLNDLLRTEVKDPRLVDVTVSDVEMSGDLGVAKVYFVTLDPDASPEGALAGFKKASGFLRGRVGHALRLRRAPELVFIRDESPRRGAEISRLIDSLGLGKDGNVDAGEPGDDDSADN